MALLDRYLAERHAGSRVVHQAPPAAADRDGDDLTLAEVQPAFAPGCLKRSAHPPVICINSDRKAGVSLRSCPPEADWRRDSWVYPGVFTGRRCTGPKAAMADSNFEGSPTMRIMARDVASYINLLEEGGPRPSRSCGSFRRKPDLLDVRFPDGTVIRALPLSDRKAQDPEKRLRALPRCGLASDMECRCHRLAGLRSPEGL